MKALKPSENGSLLSHRGPEAPVHDRPSDALNGRMRVMMTQLGLIIPRDVDFTDWERAGLQLNGLTSAYSWCLGDWLVFGKRNYADRYIVAIRAAGLQYQTLRNYAWVSRRFDMERRRNSLTFQHHAEVASLQVEEQERWLDLAERHNWTSKKLRSQLREERRQGKPESKEIEHPRRISIPDHRLVRWQRAASEVGEEFERWIINNLDHAASLALGEHDLVAD